MTKLSNAGAGLLVIPTSFQSMDMAAGDATMETASTQGPAPNPGMCDFVEIYFYTLSSP